MQLRRALWFSYFEKYGSYVIGLAATMVISRLLGPADVGVFAIGMALVGLVAVLRELGISTYVVQETELSSNRLRAAFSLALGSGLVLAALVFLASGPAGAYYEDGRVATVMAVLSLNFLIMPFGGISQALMTRDMRFDVLAWIRLLNAAVQGGMGAWLAWQGYGPISLAWASVAASAVNAAVSFGIRPHSCWPSFETELLKRVLKVGGPATVIAIVDDFLAALPELVVGRTQGVAAAGLLSRARGLSQMAHQLLARAAGPVFFAAFAAKHREGEVPAPLYLRATSCIASLGWTLLVSMCVLAEPIVMVLFGPNWMSVAPLLRWLCLAGAAALVTSGANLLLLATGGATASMRAKLMLVPITLVCVLAGAAVDTRALAFGLFVAAAAGSGLLMAAVAKHSHISWALQLLPVRDAAVVAAGAALGALAGLPFGAENLGSSLIALIVGGLGAAAGAAAALALAREHPLRAEAIAMWAKLNLKNAKA